MGALARHAAHPAPADGWPTGRRVTIRDLAEAKRRGERWPMLTAYDQYAAEIFDEADIPVLLVGDSAADNVLGYENTVGVTVDELLPLVRAVVRSTHRSKLCDGRSAIHRFGAPPPAL